MDQVAFILEGHTVYWRFIIIALAAFAAVLLAVALQLRQKKDSLALFVALPFAVLLSLFFARLIHWCCRFARYESLEAAILRPQGGYALVGAFVGTLLAFLLVRALRLTRDLPGLLDSAAPAAALGIALGRLGDLFTTADRGWFLISSAAWQRLPFASAVVNPATGVIERRFATFFVQSIWAWVIFLILMVEVLWPRKHKAARSGRVFILFMTLYCLGQIVLDSTRYDALYLPGNSTVRLVQTLCAAVLVLLMVTRSVLSMSQGGLRFWHPLSWVMALGSLGGVAYMEYYVQRHGSKALMAYAIMVGCLALFFAASRVAGIAGRVPEPPAENLKQDDQAEDRAPALV